MRLLAPLFLLLTISTFAQRDDLKTFQTIFNTPTIPEKKEVWNSITKDEQIAVRRLNFAWAMGRLNLTNAQKDYLSRFSTVLPTVKRDQLNAWQDEALQLFPKDIGIILFGSIGPYAPCDVFQKIVFQPSNCGCSVGSSFNMACDGECVAGGTRCTATNDGCGFAWLYRCDGICQAS